MPKQQSGVTSPIHPDEQQSSVTSPLFTGEPNKRTKAESSTSPPIISPSTSAGTPLLPAPLAPNRANSPQKRRAEVIDIVESLLTPLQNEIELLKSTMHSKDNEIHNLKDEIQKLKIAQNYKNLKFYGIKENHRENNFDCKRHIHSILARSNIRIPPIAIEMASRQGEVGHNRPIVVSFLHRADRELVYAKKDHIRSVCGITIDEVFPVEIENDRNELKPIAYAINRFISEKGDKIFKASVVKDKLVVNSHSYSKTSLDSLPTEIQPKNLFTKKKHNIVGFFKKWSPLSNHHLAPQRVRNVQYNCNEQFYFHQKALNAGDTVTASKILKESNPAQQKRLAKKIENFD